MSAQIAADLRAAADVLEREGWTQDQFIDSRGCMCALGALVCAASDGDAARPSLIDSTPAWGRYVGAKQALCDVLGPIPGWDDVGMISVWNDEPGRTAAEVIAALRAAADRAEATDV